MKNEQIEIQTSRQQVCDYHITQEGKTCGRLLLIDSEWYFETVNMMCHDEADLKQIIDFMSTLEVPQPIKA